MPVVTADLLAGREADPVVAELLRPPPADDVQLGRARLLEVDGDDWAMLLDGDRRHRAGLGRGGVPDPQAEQVLVLAEERGHALPSHGAKIGRRRRGPEAARLSFRPRATEAQPRVRLGS